MSRRASTDSPRKKPKKQRAPRATPDQPQEPQQPQGLTNPERLTQFLGIKPRNLELYHTALTHRSAAGVAFSEADLPAEVSNERLEFLVDAVLGLISAEALFQRYPGEPEGVLGFEWVHASRAHTDADHEVSQSSPEHWAGGGTCGSLLA